MNGYVLAGYLAVLGVLAGYSVFILAKSRRMKRVLLPARVKEATDETGSAK